MYSVFKSPNMKQHITSYNFTLKLEFHLIYNMMWL